MLLHSTVQSTWVKSEYSVFSAGQGNCYSIKATGIGYVEPRRKRANNSGNAVFESSVPGKVVQSRLVRRRGLQNFRAMMTGVGLWGQAKKWGVFVPTPRYLFMMKR